jgi:hypothetical protein
MLLPTKQNFHALNIFQEISQAKQELLNASVGNVSFSSSSSTPLVFSQSERDTKLHELQQKDDLLQQMNQQLRTVQAQIRSLENSVKLKESELAAERAVAEGIKQQAASKELELLELQEQLKQQEEKYTNATTQLFQHQYKLKSQVRCLHHNNNYCISTPF